MILIWYAWESLKSHIFQNAPRDSKGHQGWQALIQKKGRCGAQADIMTF